jgi:hypothetical protein
MTKNNMSLHREMFDANPAHYLSVEQPNNTGGIETQQIYAGQNLKGVSFPFPAEKYSIGST